MRNSVGPIIVFMMVGLWFLVSAASGERTAEPRRPYEEMDKRDFPCSEKWWLFPLTRDRVFRSLGLTTDQREEVGRLRKQFRDSLLDLKRRHNESLLNVLDDNQRRKLEEKKGEIDRYLRELPAGGHCRRYRPSDDQTPSRLPPNVDDNIEEEFNREDWPAEWRGNFPVEVGTREADANRNLMESGIDPTTLGGVKKYFKE